MARTLTQLIAVKRWADHGLYDAVGANFQQLTQEDAFLMLRILDHIQVVDSIFQHHLQGRRHLYRAARSEKMPELEVLGKRARELDEWYTSYVARATDEELDQTVEFVFTSGKPARMTRREMVLHVCLHGTYHRGNAGTLLQLRGLTPSRDSVTDYLEYAA